jgi:short/branched chain acyl-CoA dehydrogenase
MTSPATATFDHGMAISGRARLLAMDFDLTQDQRDFRAAIREFAEEVVAPRAAEMDERGELPMDIVKQMGEMGLFGLPFPEEYGGQGSDFLTLCIAIEELARIDSSIAITLEAGVGLGANPIFEFGTEEQKQRWLVPMARGEILGSFGLTEPGGGSDAGATKTTARLEDGEWVINGSKEFITNSGTPITGLCSITAVTGTEPGGHKEITAIIVPQDTPGFEVGKSYRKIGWHASDTHPLSFSDCRVPEEHLLGERGKGFAQFLKILDDGRIAIAALSVGLAQGCLEESVKYANERTAFKRPIGAFQGLQFKIADIRVAVETARMYVYYAAWLRDQGRPYKTQASIAKLYASEIAVTAAREAVQVHGGYGFVEEFPVARFYRDSKVLEIGEGTSEVQRLLIARDLGLPGTKL